MTEANTTDKTTSIIEPDQRYHHTAVPQKKDQRKTLALHKLRRGKSVPHALIQRQKTTLLETYFWDLAYI